MEPSATPGSGHDDHCSHAALLSSVAYAVQADVRLGALKHVLQLISALLDGSVLYTPARAAATGSVRLFKRVTRRVLAAPPELSLLQHWFSKALHWAAVNGSLEMVKCVHEYHPGRLAGMPLRMATLNGDLAMLQWLIRHRTDEICTHNALHVPNEAAITCCMLHVCRVARSRRHFHVVRWLVENGFPTELREIGDHAAAKGDLATVQWIHDLQVNGTFSARAMDGAAVHGHLAVVQFLYAHRREGCTGMAIPLAKLYGHEDVARYLSRVVHAHEDIIWYEFLSAAASEGRLDLLKQFNEPENDQRYLQFALSTAVQGGHLELLRWMVLARRVPVSDADVSTAAHKGYLHLLMWMHEHNQGVWTPKVMDSAVRGGHLHVLTWLHANRSEGCTPTAMAYAAREGHLNVLEWLHVHRNEGGTPRAMNTAARMGHLAIVQWLHANRQEGCTTDAMDDAAGAGHLGIVQWLHEHRSEGCTTRAMDMAAACGHLDVVMWLHANRSEGCTVKAMNIAPEHVVRWLHTHRQEGCTVDAMDNAASRGNLGLLEFLHAHRHEGVSTEAAVNATSGGHLFILQWLWARYREMFDMARVRIFADRKRFEHIVAWLDTVGEAHTAPGTGIATVRQ